MDKIAGHLEVGTTGKGEVVVNHPRMQEDDNGGHLVFSPAQARDFAKILLSKAVEADRESGVSVVQLVDKEQAYRSLAMTAASHLNYASDYVVPPLTLERQAKAIEDAVRKVDNGIA